LRIAFIIAYYYAKSKRRASCFEKVGGRSEKVGERSEKRGVRREEGGTALLSFYPA
jgi:hypothetical protein